MTIELHALETPQQAAQRESEKTLFHLKKHAIRRSLQSLAAKSRKIQMQRFFRKGARPGLDELRGKTSALLTVYLKLKGREDIHCHFPKDPFSPRASARRRWFEKYSTMFLGETFTLMQEG
jgi:hypothetical protein